MGMSDLERATVALLALALVGGAAWFVGRRPRRLRGLAVASTVLAFGLVVLGAYVRLADAGLGCPDWPGCYGDLTPGHAREAIRAAESTAPHGPVTMAKAWKEMVHRYLAMVLGCLILGLAVASSRMRGRLESQPALAWLLVAVVIVQGLFGALTVTWRLMPAVVTLHLLGGMTTLLLLALFALRVDRAVRRARWGAAEGAGEADPLARLALVLLFVQLALGGWVSANYAAAVCGDLPTCQGNWWPSMDPAQGFEVARELGRSADGGSVSLAALTAVHMAHRGFALVVAAVLLVLAARLVRRGHARLGVGLAAGVALQVSLGLAVVSSMSSHHLELGAQLPLAAAHNAGAALLVITLAVINSRACSRSMRESAIGGRSLAPRSLLP